VDNEPNTSDDTPEDLRFAAALDEYYRRAKQGPVDAAAFVAEFPDVQARLEAFFAELQDVDRLAPTMNFTRAPTAPLPVIRYFGDYELLSEIARGGMGVVYRARQSSVDRIVAVKMILAGQLASSEDVARFRQEAKGAGSLQHPNVVTIFEVGEHEGQHFFSMEYVTGSNLAQLVKENPIGAIRAAEYARTIAETMQVVHQQGLLHRDLKPSNVLIDARSGLLRITDFGLAKRTDTATMFTTTGQVLGTPSYMAPEQAAGQNDRVGRHSDIYAIGAILYELATGRPPFVGETPWDTAWQVQHQEVVAPTSLNPKVPRDLETICLKCLQKDSGRRYASAQDLADDLGRFRRGEPILARPVSRAERVWRWCRRKPALASALGAAAVGFIALTISLAVFADTQRKNADVLGKALDESKQLAKDKTVLAEQKQKLANSESALRSVAEERRREVERQLLLTEAARIAGHSQVEQRDHPVRATLLAVAALETAAKVPNARVLPAEQQLRSALQYLGGRACVGHEGAINGALISADEKHLITVGDDATIRHWELDAADPSKTAKIWRGHRSPILRCVESHPWLYTTSADGELRVWDLRSKEPAGTSQLVYDKHLKHLVLGHPWLAGLTTDGRVLLWNVSDAFTDKKPLEFGPYTSALHPTRIAVEFNHLAVCADKDEIELWTLFDAEPTKKIIPKAAHRTLALSMEGRWLASSDWTDVDLWDLNGEDFTKPTHVLGGEATGLQLHFSRGGERLMQAGSYGSLMVWPMEEGLVGEPGMRLENPGASASFVAMDSDGHWVATAGDSNVAHLWNLHDVNPDRAARTLRGHDQRLSAVCFSYLGRWVATASYDGTARIFDLQRDDSFAWATSLSGYESVTLSSQLSADGRWLYLQDWRSSTARQWDLHVPNVAASEPTYVHFGGEHTRVVTPDGRWLIGKGDQSSLQKWDLREKEPKPRLLLPGLNHTVSNVAVSADGRFLATSDHDGVGRVCDITARDPATTVRTFRNPSFQPLKFSLDARWLLTTAPREVRLWSLHAKETELSSFALPALEKLHSGAQAFTPDSRWLATASGEGAVLLWDLTAADPSARPRVIHKSATPPSIAEQFGSLAISPTGRWLAAGGHGRVWMWDLQAAPGSPAKFQLRGDEHLFEQLAFSPGDRWLAGASRYSYVNIESYASAAKRLWLWDLHAPGGIPSEESHPLNDYVDQLYFTPDARRLITCGSALRIWHLEMSDLLPIAKRVTGRALTEEERRRYELDKPR
jgi:serine/threonine protein kinase/WD40 repeat protein